MIPYQGALNFFLGFFSLIPLSVRLFLGVVFGFTIIIGIVKLVLSL